MKVGQSHKVQESACTACGTQWNGATCVGEDAAPTPGDITVCICCGHLMAFGEDLKLRDLTDAEMLLVAGDKRVLAVQLARGKLK